MEEVAEELMAIVERLTVQATKMAILGVDPNPLFEEAQKLLHIATILGLMQIRATLLDEKPTSQPGIGG
ncbi:MAG: hypothetical protein M1383_01045 [Patescibacteria group bacterium]|nr:hypothetical protein [Patescibacteria group bacterium]